MQILSGRKGIACFELQMLPFTGVKVEFHYSPWWVYWAAKNSDVQLCGQMATGWDVSCRLSAPQQSTGCYDWGEFASVVVDVV